MFDFHHGGRSTRSSDWSLSSFFYLIQVRTYFAAILLFSGGHSFATTLSLNDALQWAVNGDPYFQGSELNEAAFMHDSEAADSWDNPKITSSFQSIPTDGFALNQEPMTQVKLGIQQALPRGQAARISRNIAIEQAKKEPVKRKERHAWLLREVTLDWLDWYQAEQTVALLRQESQSLAQLIEVVESSYQSGVGDTQQQNILSLRLERLRLEDTLLRETQKASVALAHLSRWFEVPYQTGFNVPETLSFGDIFPFNRSLSRQVERTDLLDILTHHPVVTLLAKDELVATQKLTLAKEQTKPKWAFEASYGYRQDRPNGVSQADFISVGVQVDLPLFSTKRQDAEVAASAARLGTTATQRRLEVRKLVALAEAKEAELANLIVRQKLFSTALLVQSENLIESALNAYMAEQGTFDAIIRARISNISIQTDALVLRVDTAKTLAELAYLYYPLIHNQNKTEATDLLTSNPKHKLLDTHLYLKQDTHLNAVSGDVEK